MSSLNLIFRHWTPSRRKRTQLSFFRCQLTCSHFLWRKLNLNKRISDFNEISGGNHAMESYWTTRYVIIVTKNLSLFTFCLRKSLCTHISTLEVRNIHMRTQPHFEHKEISWTKMFHSTFSIHLISLKKIRMINHSYMNKKWTNLILFIMRKCIWIFLDVRVVNSLWIDAER